MQWNLRGLLLLGLTLVFVTTMVTAADNEECEGESYPEFECEEGVWVAYDAVIFGNQTWRGSPRRLEGTSGIFGRVDVIGVNFTVSGQLEVPGELHIDSTVMTVDGTFIMDYNGFLQLSYSVKQTSLVGIEVSGDFLILSGSIVHVVFDQPPAWNKLPLVYAQTISGDFNETIGRAGGSDCPLHATTSDHVYHLNVSCATQLGEYPFESEFNFTDPEPAPIPDPDGPVTPFIPIEFIPAPPDTEYEFFNESAVRNWNRATAVQLLLRFNNHLLRYDLEPWGPIKTVAKVEILEARVNLVTKQIGLLLDDPPADERLAKILFADIKKVLVSFYNFTSSRLGEFTLVFPASPMNLTKRDPIYNEPLIGNFSEWSEATYVTIDVLDLPVSPISAPVAIYVSVAVIGTLFLVASITGVIIYRQKRTREIDTVYKPESQGLLDDIQ